MGLLGAITRYFVSVPTTATLPSTATLPFQHPIGTHGRSGGQLYTIIQSNQPVPGFLESMTPFGLDGWVDTYEVQHGDRRQVWWNVHNDTDCATIMPLLSACGKATGWKIQPSRRSGVAILPGDAAKGKTVTYKELADAICELPENLQSQGAVVWPPQGCPAAEAVPVTGLELAPFKALRPVISTGKSVVPAESQSGAVCTPIVDLAAQ